MDHLALGNQISLLVWCCSIIHGSAAYIEQCKALLSILFTMHAVLLAGSTVLGLAMLHSIASAPCLFLTRTCMSMMASSASTSCALKWILTWVASAFHLPFGIYRFHGQVCHAIQKSSGPRDWLVTCSWLVAWFVYSPELGVSFRLSKQQFVALFDRQTKQRLMIK